MPGVWWPPVTGAWPVAGVVIHGDVVVMVVVVVIILNYSQCDNILHDQYLPHSPDDSPHICVLAPCNCCDTCLASYIASHFSCLPKMILFSFMKHFKLWLHCKKETSNHVNRLQLKVFLSKLSCHKEKFNLLHLPPPLSSIIVITLSYQPSPRHLHHYHLIISIITLILITCSSSHHHHSNHHSHVCRFCYMAFLPQTAQPLG